MSSWKDLVRREVRHKLQRLYLTKVIQGISALDKEGQGWLDPVFQKYESGDSYAPKVTDWIPAPEV
ncbi:hypothetical protein [Pontibacter sp. H249]|uniref:hypothetical protein n=1 Tax=Pontibacter sp. H249 TaxID=3133420 RepID=UPI0030BB39FF